MCVYCVYLLRNKYFENIYMYIFLYSYNLKNIYLIYKHNIFLKYIHVCVCLFIYKAGIVYAQNKQNKGSQVCRTKRRKFYLSHPQTGKTYKIKQLITCKTTHVIYIILCSCPLLYVGKTKRALRTRIVEHMSAIRRQDHTSPVFHHFESAKHYFSDFKFLGIERVLLHRRGGNCDRKLLQREAFFLIPTGLNEEMDLACFLWREIVGMTIIPCWLRSAVNNLQLCLYKCGVAFLPHE